MPNDTAPDSPETPRRTSGCGGGGCCGCGKEQAKAAQAGASPKPAPPELESGVTRRSFMKTLGVSAAASSFAAAAEASGIIGSHLQPGEKAGPPIAGPDPVTITLTINGQARQLKVEPATTLLEALRVNLNLTGAKEICDRGSCGGCSVLIDGKLMVSCLTLAIDCVGSQITTVEGLAVNGKLDPVQEAFVRHDGLQCGYCTPGLVVACRALLNENPKPTLDQIKKGLSGNICRCGTYTNIFNAALEASGQSPIMDQKGA